jgi:hypothetical protein
MIPAYAKGGDETRSAIRRMFAEYGSFTRAAALSTQPTNVEGLRQHLILFSMKDQGRDSRDALLTLQEIVREADTAGVDKQRCCERLPPCPAAQIDTAWVQHATCC